MALGGFYIRCNVPHELGEVNAEEAVDRYRGHPHQVPVRHDGPFSGQKSYQENIREPKVS